MSRAAAVPSVVAAARRLVIKVGSSLVTNDGRGLDQGAANASTSSTGCAADWTARVAHTVASAARCPARTRTSSTSGRCTDQCRVHELGHLLHSGVARVLTLGVLQRLLSVQLRVSQKRGKQIDYR